MTTGTKERSILTESLKKSRKPDFYDTLAKEGVVTTEYVARLRARYNREHRDSPFTAPGMIEMMLGDGVPAEKIIDVAKRRYGNHPKFVASVEAYCTKRS